VSSPEKRVLLNETHRLSGKISKAVDGEDARTALYALLAIAVHCAHELSLSDEEARRLFEAVLHAGKPS
jgi:hypothetical protein